MIKVKLSFFFFIAITFLSCGDNISKKEYTPPQDLYPSLFVAVQRQHLFKDDKYFADAIPRMSGEKIEEFYIQDKNKPGFSLTAFVNEFFIIPKPTELAFKEKTDLKSYLEEYFTQLIMQPNDDGGSLIPTRNPYIGSGIGYNEFNYSSDFFVMLGLKSLNKDSLLKGSIINYVQFIQDFGYVPLSNRSYTMDQTALPYIPVMINLADKNKSEILKYAASQLTKDYQFWMAAESKEMVNQQLEASKKGDKSYKTVVFLKGNQLLNKLDLKSNNKPRPNNYNFDAARNKNGDSLYYTNVRIAEMSGWEKSNRWISAGKLRPGNFVPLDLNALLYQYEKTLAEAYDQKGEKVYADNFNVLAKKRKDIYDQYFWNEEKGFYTDFNYKINKQSNMFTLAGMYPMYIGLTNAEKAKKVAQFIKTYLLKSGGLASSYNFETKETDNLSSAEMHYIVIESLKKYNENALAEEIKKRFLKTVSENYLTTGIILEKYDVLNGSNVKSSSSVSKTSGAAGAILHLMSY